MKEGELDIRVDGYYRDMSSNPTDIKGNPLRALSDYNKDSPDHSYVSLAVNPKTIKLGCMINIEGFNDSSGAPILFCACDRDECDLNQVEIFCGNKQQADELFSPGQTKKLKIIDYQKLKRK